MDWLYLIGRLLFGGFWIMSGINHFTGAEAMAGYAAASGVPSPQAAVLLSGLLALVGGLLIVLGLLPRWGVLLLALFLVPVTFMMHDFWADTDPQARQGNMMNFTKNMALLGGNLMLLAIPKPWPLSIDEMRLASRRTVERGRHVEATG